MGGFDRTTGDAWYLTFTKAKDKKLAGSAGWGRSYGRDKGTGDPF